MAALAAAIGACVGPNFHRPAAPTVDRYTIEPTPEATAAAPVPDAAPPTAQPAAPKPDGKPPMANAPTPGPDAEPPTAHAGTPGPSIERPTANAAAGGPSGAAQRFLMQQEVPKNWWTLFGSEALDALVTEALRANPDVASAQAALRQALENTAAQRGSYFPNLQGTFDASRNRDALGTLSPTLATSTPLYNLFTPQVTISYVPDIFGANRRAVESLAAQAEASRYQLDATYLTLTANVVSTAIQEAGLRAQVAATLSVIELERESLDVLRHELELGAIAEADVYAQDAALAQLEGTLPPLNKQLHQARDQLAVLTGHLPADYKPANFELDQLVLPADLPLGVPSQLVERRPDVRAAEAQLHAATAQVGFAIASLLPQVTITGNLGSTAALIADLFKPGTGFWSIGGTATATLFDGGTLIHRKRAADAALEQAAAQYRSAVLTAFQNVADALHALETDAEALAAANRAEAAAQKSLGVTHRQLELGSVSYVALVISEQAYQQSVVSVAQARANRLADTAALFQALGGSISPVAAVPIAPAPIADAPSTGGAGALGPTTRAAQTTTVTPTTPTQTATTDPTTVGPTTAAAPIAGAR
jgi:NodT family efflux transporter outer membrane factor (OMF) lipoprotein